MRKSTTSAQEATTVKEVNLVDDSERLPTTTMSTTTIPTTGSVSYAAAARPEPDVEKLRSILDNYGNPDPSVIEKLKKSYKDKNGRWHEMELDYIGHATQTKWLIETDPLWHWEPVSWENGRPKIHVNGDTAELWIRLTVCGKTVLGVGTAPAHKSDVSKELIGDALRNAAMRLGYALKLWSKGSWDDPTPPADPTPAAEDVDSTTGEIINDPYEWALHSMLEATSIAALDAVASLAKQRLSQEERDQLRPIYLERKVELEAGEA